MTTRASRSERLLATKGNAYAPVGNALPLREAGNGRIIPITQDLILCPTCQHYFSKTQDGQRYCCSQHRVTGCKRRRKRLLVAWVVMVTTMSGGRISPERAAECLDTVYRNAEGVIVAVEDIVRLWGYTFDENDLLVRRKAS